MIYAYDAIEDGMHAVMFPVALHFGFVRWACCSTCPRSAAIVGSRNPGCNGGAGEV